MLQSFSKKLFGKYRKQTVLLLFLGTFTTTLLAQSTEKNTPSNNWGIRAGWTQSLISDQHSSPLLYQADAMNIGGIYQRQSNSLFEISLTMQIGTNQAQRHGQRSIFIEEEADIYGEVESYELKANPFLSLMTGDLRVKMLWPINEHHSLGMSFNARHILTGIGADTWHYTQLDIAPEYRVTYSIANLEAHANFSLPILAGVVRPNYAYDPSLPDALNYWWGYVKTGSSITSIHQLINPRANAGLMWHFDNGRTVGVNYVAAWTSFPDPRPLRMFENGIDVIYFF